MRMKTRDSDSDTTVNLSPKGTPDSPSTSAANEDEDDELKTLTGNISLRRSTGVHVENRGEFGKKRNS